MAGDTSEQTSSTSGISQEEVIRRLAEESNLSEKAAHEAWRRIIDALSGNMELANVAPFVQQWASATNQISELIKLLTEPHIMHGINLTKRMVSH